MEEHIGSLRAELLHKEQETQRVQLQLAKEVEERERAERKVRLRGSCGGAAGRSGRAWQGAGKAAGRPWQGAAAAMRLAYGVQQECHLMRLLARPA